MLLGDQSTFAIECEIRDIVDGFIYCNFRFWIQGNPIGDWNKEAVLGVLIHSANIIMEYQGNRYIVQVDTVDPNALWGYIDRISHSDDPDEMEMALEEHYGPRFLLHQLADDSVATVCKVIIVEHSNGIQRLLWKKIDSSDIQEIILPA